MLRLAILCHYLYLYLVVAAGGCGSSASRPDVALESGAADVGATDLGAGDARRDASGLDANDASTRDANAADRSHADAVDLGPAIKSGVLLGGTGALPGPIAGLRYTSGGVRGLTDAQGRFDYEAGAPIVFQVADITLRPAAGAPKLSPFQLAGVGACVFGPELEQLLVLLYSLDADGDPSTGTALTAFPAATPIRALASLTPAEVAAAVVQLMPGVTPLTAAEAVDRFVRQIDDEAWTQKSQHDFTFATALSRGQGVASDGTNWFFSGMLSLERTDASFASQKLNAIAIPPLLLLQGSQHIGDIDVYNGTLYAPIEDSKYAHPMIVLYDAVSLAAGAEDAVPQALQTEGVPWVAVNGPAGELYLAEWDPTPQLNIFSLSNVSYLRSLPLRWPPDQASLGRIQGAKVFEGALYMASDEAKKTIYKVNLATGTVLRLFAVPIGSEQEGLAFATRPDGTQLHTLDVNASSTGVELRHHLRTRLPLRQDICP